MRADLLHKQSETPPRPNEWSPRLRWFLSEFLVVVTGVLVALTINAWWESRAEHVLEQSYLQRLADDLAADSSEFGRLIAIERTRGGQAKMLLSALSDPAAMNSEPLVRAIEQAGWATSVRLSPHTFQEMQSTGNLRLIRNPAVRNALSAYYYQAINNRDFLYEYGKDRAWTYARAAAAVLPVNTRVSISLEQPIDTAFAGSSLPKLAAVPNIRALLSEVLVSTANLEWNYVRRKQLAIDALSLVRAEQRRR